MTDDELMKRIAQGDPVAFQNLFDRHTGRGLGFAARLLGEIPLAEDVLQETWLKVVRLSASYQSSGQFQSWFMTLIKNASLNLIRSRKRLTFDSETETLDTGADPLEQLTTKEKFNLLEKRLEELPENQRIALVLWAAHDQGYDEIASELSTTVSAVKSLLFRARRTLERGSR